MVSSTEKKIVAGKPSLWFRDPIGTNQCTGCHYPIIQRLVCELLEEMDLGGRTVGISGCGCNFMFTFALDIDSCQAPHGRPPDIATGVKRVRPDTFVFTIQGDGDAIAIGTEPLIQSAARAERISVIMVNNAGYAMTGGQMAPTTFVGQVSTTTPEGRDPKLHGYPIHTAELLATLDGVAYSARTSVHTPTNYRRTKKAMKAVFEKQKNDIGFGFLEIVAACPTNWHLTPVESLKYIEDVIIPRFPLGEFKNVDQLS